MQLIQGTTPDGKICLGIPLVTLDMYLDTPRHNRWPIHLAAAILNDLTSFYINEYKGI
jgi:hypothetical protein